MINRDLITLLLQQELERASLVASNEYIDHLNAQIIEIHKPLQDGETLKSHDISIILFTMNGEFATEYMYTNGITHQDAFEFLQNAYSNDDITVLGVWS